jgi:2-dehydro-3-deoxygalactonokinase
VSDYKVIGDWGTSRLRLFRVEQGRIVARREGPGIGAVAGRAEAAFTDTIAPWIAEQAPAAITLCGMAGARDGWVEAPYADCPADAAAWRAAAKRFDWRGVPVAIMAGLACEGTDGIADVMRGEETQIFGACALDPALATGRHRRWDRRMRSATRRRRPRALPKGWRAQASANCLSRCSRRGRCGCAPVVRRTGRSAICRGC